MRRLCIVLSVFLAAPRAMHGGVASVEPIADTTFAEAGAASQLWLVGTRRLPHGPRASARPLTPDVSRFERPGVWRAAPHDALLAPGDPPLTTVVFVHGNDTDEAWARSRGLGIYQALTRRAEPPFRLIVWSWPAEYVTGGFRHDARVKAERADSNAYYLAQFLSQLDHKAPVQVVGYSLGARVVTGGLHLLGGGSLAGRRLESIGDIRRPPVHATLIAAAIDDDWLLPGHRHGRAIAAADRMVVLVNPQDRVLRWYRFLSRDNGATALGVHGVASLRSLGPQRYKLEQVNVNSYVGGQHGWSRYASSPQIVQQLKRDILLASGGVRDNVASGPPVAVDEDKEEIRLHHGGLFLYP
jgi:hypothetical protein